MNIERAFILANRAMSTLSRAWIIRLTLLCVGVIGVLDYLFGLEISLSIFYLCPVGIASWYAGRKAGAMVALISAFTALAGDFSEGHLFAQPALLIWNGFLHLGFMLVVAFLLDRLHATIENEHTLARSDPMTGLLNRRAFLEQLQHHLALAARAREPVSLAYIDLDDFKRINDEGGHHEGDRVLQLVASMLLASVRCTDVVARLGGDEFALLITGADRTAAESLITNVRHFLQQAFAGERTAVTCSIGCVTFQEPLPCADDAIRTADLLMYNVKRRGKNAVAFETFEFKQGQATQPGAGFNARQRRAHERVRYLKPK